MRLLLALVFAVFGGVAAQAQEGAVDPIGCGTDVVGCAEVARAYTKGTPPFRKDPARADLMKREAAALGVELCAAGDAIGCGVAFSLREEDGGAAARIGFFEASTARCEGGDLTSCLQFLLFAQIERVEVSHLEQRVIQATTTHTDSFYTRCAAGADRGACARLFGPMVSSIMMIPSPNGAPKGAMIELAKAQCALGLGAACGALSDRVQGLVFAGPSDPDYKAMTALLTHQCDAGIGEACIALSYASIFPEQAFDRACDAGLGDGCVRYAKLKYSRDYVSSPNATVLESITSRLGRGCDLGAIYACHMLAALTEG